MLMFFCQRRCNKLPRLFRWIPCEVMGAEQKIPTHVLHSGASQMYRDGGAHVMTSTSTPQTPLYLRTQTDPSST